MGGRPPKSVEEHKLDGTFREDRHGDRGFDVPHIADIKPPKGLTKEARKLWKEIIPPLCQTGIIAVIDYPALEEAFRAYGTAVECKKYVDEIEGGVAAYLATRKRMDSNLMNEYLKHMERFDKIMMKFGMTPVERAKLR